MGREIYVEIRNTRTNEKQDIGYVCGRTDATNRVATLVDYDEKVLKTDTEVQEVIENLSEFKESDNSEFARVIELTEDLRAARRNCTTFEEFRKFTEELDSAREWMSDFESDAGNIIDDLLQAKVKIAKQKRPKDWVVVIGDSE